MIILYHTETGEIDQIVESTEGCDLTGLETLDIEALPDWDVMRWDAETLSFVEDLTSLRLRLHDQIDREAGQFRVKHITAVPGQPETYQFKLDEAKDYLAELVSLNAGKLLTATILPNPTNYPYLASEASHCGMTTKQVAELVRDTATAWHTLNAQVEGRRRGAIVAVNAAATKAEAIAAASVDWDSIRQ